MSSKAAAVSRGRIRRRPVSFGNPALGTYRGCVFTWEGESSSFCPCPALPPIPSEATAVEQLVAMSDVPAEQVPEGILNLARSHRPFIEHLKIMVADSDEKEHESGLLEASTSAPPRTELPLPPEAELAALSLQGGAAINSDTLKLQKDTRDTKDLRLMTSGDTRIRPQDILSTTTDDKERPTRSYVILFRLSTQEAADTFVRDLHNVPFTSLDETERCSVYHVVGLQADEGVSLMSPFFAPSASDLGLTARASTSSSCSSAVTQGEAPNSTSSPRNGALEVHNCAVCLERMNLESESLLTTVCNHSFHLDCLLQWQDSPCPVCRYDHSGLNEALSQCHVCGTTERNYVCLICGVVSCGGGGSSSVAAARRPTSSTRSDEQAQPSSLMSMCASSSSGNTQNGLAHGSSPMDSGSPPMSHARQHYDETLHAYALDTETQHVWDYCGQGYVHRLLQNAKDDKLVEVNDPNNTSHERSLSSGLSDAQEGEVVHRKLEGFASQYYTLLKSQLEQQRIYYESRLEEIRREYGCGRPRKKSASPSADLILALKQERNQLMQRRMTLRQRYEKVSDEVAFLKNMNESLEANKGPMKRQIAEAQRQRAEAREMIQQCLPVLEDKVTKLMLQLEESTAVSNDIAEQAPDSMDDEKKPAAKG